MAKLTRETPASSPDSSSGLVSLDSHQAAAGDLGNSLRRVTTAITALSALLVGGGEDCPSIDSEVKRRLIEGEPDHKRVEPVADKAPEKRVEKEDPRKPSL